MLFKREHGAAVGGLFVIGLIVIGLSMATGLVGCDGTYSEGFRDGTLQKFASKGMFIKSWEGELATQGIRMQVDKSSSVWEFSVADPVVVEALNKVPPNTMIRIHYRQVLRNSIWYGTDYRAEKIDILTK